MNFITELWPIFTAALSVVVLYFGYIQQLRIRVAVLEKTVEDQQTTIDHMRQRQDSHSKKTDDILKLITDLKLEMVKQIGTLSGELGAIGAEVNNINRCLTVNDEGASLKRKKK